MQQPTYEELNKISSQVREEKKQKYIEKINIAKNDAINHITQGCFEKMTNAASNGFTKVDIYSFSWIEDPKEVFDKHGNKTIFEGNIRLLDLITKSNQDFIQTLNNFFNKDCEAKYYCGVYKKKDNDDGIYTWHIFVSWAPLNEYVKKEHMDEDIYEKKHYERSGRGGRGGRGGRDGRGVRDGRGGRGRHDGRGSLIPNNQYQKKM